MFKPSHKVVDFSISGKGVDSKQNNNLLGGGLACMVAFVVKMLMLILSTTEYIIPDFEILFHLFDPFLNFYWFDISISRF